MCFRLPKYTSSGVTFPIPSWYLAELYQFINLPIAATSDSSARANVWDVAEGAMDLGIAVAAFFGGVYGMKVAALIKQARVKSKALREIIEYNEIFKNQHAESAQAFNAVHETQSPQTKQLVTQIKST